MSKIIVAGYPKSGNTWLVRLVGDLICCPVAGFWNENHNEIAEEGANRLSEYSCYKAHQTYEGLKKCPDWEDAIKIIYIIRDPRDIAISGANYFRFYKCPLLLWFRRYFHPIERYFYHIIFKTLFAPEHKRIGRMLNALCYGGDKLLSKWCSVPWQDHVVSYQGREVLFVRYEDLLAQPHQEAVRIVNFIGIDRSVEEISSSVERQSFRSKQAEFKKKKDFVRSRFLRKGKAGQWMEKLGEAQQKLVISVMGDKLKEFGYLD